MIETSDTGLSEVEKKLRDNALGADAKIRETEQFYRRRDLYERVALALLGTECLGLKNGPDGKSFISELSDVNQQLVPKITTAILTAADEFAKGDDK